MANGVWARRGATQEFIEQALCSATDKCLIWPYSRNACGYGTIRRDGRTVLVHRVICADRHGAPQDETTVVRHTCGNGHLGCVNPKHLCWGTRKENGVDMAVHGRTKTKLTKDVVRQIRAAYAECGNQREVSRQFNISFVHVHKVVRGRSWAWLE